MKQSTRQNLGGELRHKLRADYAAAEERFKKDGGEKPTPPAFSKATIRAGVTRIDSQQRADAAASERDHLKICAARRRELKSSGLGPVEIQTIMIAEGLIPKIRR